MDGWVNCNFQRELAVFVFCTGMSWWHTMWTHKSFWSHNREHERHAQAVEFASNSCNHVLKRGSVV